MCKISFVVKLLYLFIVYQCQTCTCIKMTYNDGDCVEEDNVPQSST